jgi:hypothetical protein
MTQREMTRLRVIHKTIDKVTIKLPDEIGQYILNYHNM